MEQWAIRWGFKLSVAKTQVICFAERHKELSIKLYGETQEQLKVICVLGGCVSTIGGSHSSAFREGLLQGTGEENSADSRTSDSGGTMRFSSGPRNTGPALYPPQGA